MDSTDDKENAKTRFEIANTKRNRKTKRGQILWQRSETEQEKKVNRSVTNVSYICLLKSLAAKRSLRVQHTFAFGLLVNDSSDNPRILFMANLIRSSATKMLNLSL